MNDDTREETLAPSLWDRIGVGAVALLLAAFLIGTMAPLISSAGAEITGKRDDGSGELVAVEDDDDDDDDTRTGNGDSNSKSSNSANTPTGTTKGTGDSKSVTNSSDRSANTKTGTTNTGASRKSVSNSS